MTRSLALFFLLPPKISEKARSSVAEPVQKRLVQASPLRPACSKKARASVFHHPRCLLEHGKLLPHFRISPGYSQEKCYDVGLLVLGLPPFDGWSASGQLRQASVGNDGRTRQVSASLLLVDDSGR